MYIYIYIYLYICIPHNATKQFSNKRNNFNLYRKLLDDPIATLHVTVYMAQDHGGDNNKYCIYISPLNFFSLCISLSLSISNFFHCGNSSSHFLSLRICTSLKIYTEGSCFFFDLFISIHIYIHIYIHIIYTCINKISITRIEYAAKCIIISIVKRIDIVSK